MPQRLYQQNIMGGNYMSTITSNLHISKDTMERSLMLVKSVIRVPLNLFT